MRGLGFRGLDQYTPPCKGLHTRFLIVIVYIMKLSKQVSSFLLMPKAFPFPNNDILYWRDIFNIRGSGMIRHQGWLFIEVQYQIFVAVFHEYLGFCACMFRASAWDGLQVE